MVVAESATTAREPRALPGQRHRSVLKLATGRWRELNAGSVVLSLLCLVYYVFGLPH
jgi:hypothetical protein